MSNRKALAPTPFVVQSVVLIFVLLFQIPSFAGGLTICASGDCPNGETFWIASTGDCSGSSGYVMKNCAGKFFEITCMIQLPFGNRVGTPGKVDSFRVSVLDISKETKERVENIALKGKTLDADENFVSAVRRAGKNTKTFMPDELFQMVQFLVSDISDNDTRQSAFVKIFDVFVQRIGNRISNEGKLQVEFEAALVGGILQYRKQWESATNRQFSLDIEKQQCTIYVNNIAIGDFSIPPAPPKVAELINAKKLLSQDLVLANAQEHRASLMPNPATTDVTFSLPGVMSESTIVEIYSLAGVKVKETLIAPNTATTKLSIEDLPNSAYIVRYRQGKHLSTQTLIIQR